MSPTATGPLLFLLALYVFAFRPTQLAYFAVFFAPFSATAIVNFNSVGYKAGGVGITPAMTFTLMLFVAQFIYGYGARRLRISTGHLVQLGLILLFLAVALFSLTMNAAMGHIIDPVKTHTVYLTIYLGATILFSLEFVREGGVERAIRVARASAIFVCIWGLLQLVCSVTGIPYPSVLFNNSNSDSADMFAQNLGAFARISSVAVEPSVMAASLLHFAAFGVTILSRSAEFRTRYWVWPVGLVVLTLLFSTSSTAYVGLVVIAFLIALERPVLSLIAGVPLLTIFFGLLASWPKARDVLLASTINKNESFSYNDRTSQVVRDLNSFYSQPLLGSGWGRAVNFNAATTMLCNVGVIGTTVFVVCGLVTLVSLTLGAQTMQTKDPKMSCYAAGIRNALIVAVVIGITSGMKYVFMSDWVFWALGIAIASRLEIAQKAQAEIASWMPGLRMRRERMTS